MGRARDGSGTGEIPRVRSAVGDTQLRSPVDAPRDAGDPGPSTGVIHVRKGRRSELRRQLREIQRLRTLTLVVLMAVLAGAIPLFLGVRAATRDPVFAELDSLSLPDWATVSHLDQTDGSRWCITVCRNREREWMSSHGPEETWGVYAAALRDHGWKPFSHPSCVVDRVEGFAGCWQHDEYVLDLWSRKPVCDMAALRAAAVAAPPVTSAGPAASATPVAPLVCPGAVVTAKVYERVAYPPGRQGG